MATAIIKVLLFMRMSPASSVSSLYDSAIARKMRGVDVLARLPGTGSSGDRSPSGSWNKI
jgi:hypothetical protein